MNKLLNLTGKKVRVKVGNQPQVCNVLYDEAPMEWPEEGLSFEQWFNSRRLVVSWMCGKEPYYTRVSRRNRSLEVLDEQAT